MSRTLYNSLPSLNLKDSTNQVTTDLSDRGPSFVVCPEGARLIPLTKGYFAIVDEPDFERVSALRWRAIVKPSGKVYAMHGALGLYMHRFIVDAPQGFDVDHWNNDGIDNRRRNLTVCTRAENTRKGLRRPNACKHKGVAKKINRFQAKIGVDGKRLNLGSFLTEEEAAIAYDRAATRYFGKFAVLNFPNHETAPVTSAQQHGEGSEACRDPKGICL